MQEKKLTNPGLFQIGAGSIFASMIISGFILGYAVDQWLGMTPIFMLSFGILGLIGGMKKVHDMLKYENREIKYSDHS